MTDVPLKLNPGVSLVRSAMLVEAGFSNANLVRFYGGLLQKRGGWTRLTSKRLQGTCRGLHAFADLAGVTYVGAGTEQLLQLYTPTITTAPLSSLVPPSPLIPDVTPVASVSNLNAPFSTQVNSPTVTVVDPASAANVGDWIYIATLTYVGGIVLQGLYQVAGLTGNGYTITAPTNATATVNGGGTTLSFTTVGGSNFITVAFGGYPFVTGDSILVYVPTTVGGIALSGIYDIAVTGGVAKIGADSPASNNDNASENGGAIQILHLLATQSDQANPGAYGAGPYGAGPYGVGAASLTTLSVREWSVDNFGQIMVANPKGGGLYAWTPPFTYDNRATLTGNDAPQFSQGCFVAMPEEQMISFGSDAGGFQDPMLVRFSSVGSFQQPGDWTASATNQAGSFRLSRGSTIVGGMWSEFGGLLWTDVGLWLMTYIQPPFVYSFKEIARGCGLISMRAAADVGGIVVWPGVKTFWMFNGASVQPLPCDVWDWFFENLDQQYLSSICAFANSDFSEVAWHFPPLGGGGVASSYVNLNLSMLAAGAPPAQCWDFGTLTRTAGRDISAGFPPVGADGPNGLLQAHETQNDADGVAMPSFAETGWMRLAEGHQYMTVERLFPDFVFGVGGGTVNVSVIVSEYDVDPDLNLSRTFGPFACTPTTEHIIPRCRGRLVKLRFDFSTLGTFARLGEMIARTAPAGGR